MASTAGLGFGAVLTYCPLQRSPLSPKICTALTTRLAIRGPAARLSRATGLSGDARRKRKTASLMRTQGEGQENWIFLKNL
nr:MAG TPA: hypothetical protein [Bacteriophage sp.]